MTDGVDRNWNNTEIGQVIDPSTGKRVGVVTGDETWDLLVEDVALVAGEALALAGEVEALDEDLTVEKGKIVTAQTAIGRLDPGVAGTNRQVMRIVGGEPRWRTEPMFRASDFASLQAMIDEAQSAVTAGVGGAMMDLGEAEHVITEPLTFHRFAGGFMGSGLGPSPAYTADPGKGSVIRWNGGAGEPMILVTDGRHMVFENFRLEGKLASGDVGAVQPTYGIEFRNAGADTYGTNRYSTVRNVSIGRYPWSSQGTQKGDVATGIGWTGTDGNNDQMVIDHVWVMYPTERGLYVPNSQSVAHQVRALSVFDPGIAGVKTGTTIQFTMLKVFPYILALDIGGTNTTVEIDGYCFEGGTRLANIGPNASLILKGAGYVQAHDLIAEALADPTNADKGILVQMAPGHMNAFHWEDGRLTDESNTQKMAHARIEIGPMASGVSPDGVAYVGNFNVNVKNLIGGHPTQVRFRPLAAMWAGSPMSRGTVEWTSTRLNASGQPEKHAFRNELRHSSHPSVAAGSARNTLNKTVWDPVVIDSVTTHVSVAATPLTVTSSHYIILVNSLAAAITLNLPTAVGIEGKTYIVRKTDADTTKGVTVDPNGAETIGGAGTKMITSTNGFMEFRSDGANWVIDSQGGTIV